MDENKLDTQTEMFDDMRIWGEHASCKGHPAELWYVEAYNTREGQQMTREAKNICYTCVVQEKCLEYALQNEEVHGVWGGLTPKERGVGRLARIARRKERLRRQAMGEVNGA